MVTIVIHVPNVNFQSVISNYFLIEHWDEKHTMTKTWVPRYRTSNGEEVVGVLRLQGLLTTSINRDMQKKYERMCIRNNRNYIKYATLLLN